MLNSRFLKLASIIIVNISLIYLMINWLGSHVNFSSIINELKFIDQTSILLAIFLGILLNLIYGLRMGMLLDIKLIPSIQIVIMGFGLNSFLPLRLGEVIKVFFAKQFFRVNLVESSMATIIEKSMDLGIILGLGLIFVFSQLKSLFLLKIFSIGIVPLILLIVFKDYFIKKINSPHLKSIIHSVLNMLAKEKMKSILLITVTIWFLSFFMFYLFFKWNITAELSFGVLDAITLLIFTTLSLAIPSMPAGIGLFESGIVFYLTEHFNFLADKAVAYALIFHLIIILPQILFTIIILFLNMKNSRKFGGLLNES